MEETQLLYNTKKIKELTVAYVRVSTERQKKEGYSIKNQNDLAKEYAQKNGWELCDEYIFEENESASKIYGNDINTDDFTRNFINRPQFKRLLNLLETGEFRHLIVYSRDRLTRVLEEYIALEFFLKRYNVDIHFTRVGENIENENSNISHFINIVLSSLTEYESSLLSTRIKDANRTCILDGHWAGGRTPFGYFREYLNQESRKKHSTLIKSDFQSIMVNEIFELYIQGYGYRKISKIMNKRHSYIKWTKSKIEAIINNRTYTGHIAWNRRGGRRQKFKKYSDNDIVLSPLMEDAAIINEDTWELCSSQKLDRSENKDPYYYKTPFILKDRLICSKCDSIMKTKNPGRSKSNVYKCSSSNCSNCKCIVPARKVHYYFAQNIQNTIKINNYDKFWDIYCEKFNEKKQQYTSFMKVLVDRIEQYKLLLVKIDNKLNNEGSDIITKALKLQRISISRQLKEYMKTKSELQESISIKQMDIDAFNNFVSDYVNSLFKNFDIETTIKDNISNEQLMMNSFKVREFVLTFIDKVYIDCENRNINSMEIIFKSPEFT